MGGLKDSKRFKLFDEAFLWFGENKITIGDTKSGEHITLLVNKEGILDVHKTIEGTEKKYEPLVKLDLKQLGEQLENNPDIVKNFEKDIMDNIKQVTFTEPEFAECYVILVRSEKEMQNLVRRVKRTTVLDAETVNEEELILWPEAKDRIKGKALVLDKTGSSIGYLFNTGGKIFFMKGDYMMNSYFSQLIMNLAYFYNTEQR